MLQPLHFEQHAIHHHHHPDRPLYGERLHHLEDGRARHGAARVHDAEGVDVEDLLHRAFVLYSDALRCLRRLHLHNLDYIVTNFKLFSSLPSYT